MVKHCLRVLRPWPLSFGLLAVGVDPCGRHAGADPAEAQHPVYPGRQPWLRRTGRATAVGRTARRADAAHRQARERGLAAHEHEYGDAVHAQPVEPDDRTLLRSALAPMRCRSAAWRKASPSGRSPWASRSRQRGTPPGTTASGTSGVTTADLPNDQGFDEWFGIPRTTDEALWRRLPRDTSEDIAPPEQIMEGTKGREEPSPECLRRRAAATDRRRDHPPRGRVHASGRRQGRQAVLARTSRSPSPTCQRCPIPPSPARPATATGPTCSLKWITTSARCSTPWTRSAVRDDTVVIFTSDNGAEFVKLLGRVGRTVAGAVLHRAERWASAPRS